MCGIFALLNYADNDFKKIKTEFDKGYSRGPEDTQFEYLKKYKTYLGFHRLSINGLNKESNQPLNINDCILICNGEIYNYRELGKSLNITFKTNSDCEVIIHLYKKFGIEYTLDLLDGVFAFMLIDNNTIYVARDAFGVRPLFWINGNDFYGFASQLKQLNKLKQDETVKQFQPGSYIKLEKNKVDKWNIIENKLFYTLPTVKLENTLDEEEVLSKIRYYFEDAIKKRCINTSDRPIACLLSGGLDSSIVAAIVNKYVDNLETFSIGIKGGEDLKYANQVASFLGTRHHCIELSEQDFIDAIPETIYAIESFDTTTVRASVGNYLVGKYIKKHSNAKVIFNGDGSDELMGGYLYFHHAGDNLSFDKECRRLLKNIHYFDVLRSDRTISTHGLEPRTPFLDKKWVDYFISLGINIRNFNQSNEIEKYLFRKAFEKMNLLPKNILFRKKEAFSDGVSSVKRSWFEIINEQASNLLKKQEITDNPQELLDEYKKVYLRPSTIEQLYFRSLFDIYYHKCSHIIPYFWMPSFIKANDASARTLNIYK